MLWCGMSYAERLLRAQTVADVMSAGDPARCGEMLLLGDHPARPSWWWYGDIESPEPTTYARGRGALEELVAELRAFLCADDLDAWLRVRVRNLSLREAAASAGLAHPQQMKRRVDRADLRVRAFASSRWVRGGRPLGQVRIDTSRDRRPVGRILRDAWRVRRQPRSDRSS